MVKTHGMRGTRFYKIWCGMKKRCQNEKCSNYHDYGKRGITICNEWNDFMNFKNDMYESYKIHSELYGEKNTSIDRKNVNGNYTKENCRWATMKEQNSNTRKIKLYEYKGELLSLAEIARREKMNYTTLRSRLFEYGWSLNEALKKSHMKWSKKSAEVFDYKGQKLTLKQISEFENIGYTTLYNRIKNMNMSLEDAINKVPYKKRKSAN